MLPKETCPYCGTEGCEAEFTDVSVGFVQTGPFHCDACGATEIGGYDNTTPSQAEREVGWYAPNSPNMPSTVSTIDGKFIDSATALTLYRAGVVDHVPFQLSMTPPLRQVLEGLARGTPIPA